MKEVLNVKGMMCEHCEKKVEKALAEINVKAVADHNKETVEVNYDEKTINIKDIMKVIKSCNFKVK